MDRLLSEQEVKKWLERWIGYLDKDMIYRMKIGTRDIPSAEPCEDAISRQDVLDLIEDMTDQFGIRHRVITEGVIKLLPSVKQDL